MRGGTVFYVTCSGRGLTWRPNKDASSRKSWTLTLGSRRQLGAPRHPLKTSYTTMSSGNEKRHELQILSWLRGIGSDPPYQLLSNRRSLEATAAHASTALAIPLDETLRVLETLQQRGLVQIRNRDGSKGTYVVVATERGLDYLEKLENPPLIVSLPQILAVAGIAALAVVIEGKENWPTAALVLSAFSVFVGSAIDPISREMVARNIGKWPRILTSLSLLCAFFLSAAIAMTIGFKQGALNVQNRSALQGFYERGVSLQAEVPFQATDDQIERFNADATKWAADAQLWIRTHLGDDAAARFDDQTPAAASPSFSTDRLRPEKATAYLLNYDKLGKHLINLRRLIQNSE